MLTCEMLRSTKKKKTQTFSQTNKRRTPKPRSCAASFKARPSVLQPKLTHPLSLEAALPLEGAQEFRTENTCTRTPPLTTIGTFRKLTRRSKRQVEGTHILYICLFIKSWRRKGGVSLGITITWYCNKLSRVSYITIQLLATVPRTELRITRFQSTCSDLTTSGHTKGKLITFLKRDRTTLRCHQQCSITCLCPLQRRKRCP